MYTLWLISEDSALPATLAVHLRELGGVFLGVPERSAFKDADRPDLVVVAEAADSDEAALERMLGFLRGIPALRRAPAPVLFIASAHPTAMADLVAELVDDRPCVVLRWPLDPPRLIEKARALLAAVDTPPSLRERARRNWVRDRVERLYAGLELPALRHAIDPRNAPRPVLLVGEPGSHRGLLARYIHNLAEPPRGELISVPPAALPPLQVEATVLARSSGRRATVYLPDVERAAQPVQEELAQLLGESGAIAIEPIRWIASATRADLLARGLRAAPWLTVELPPLRERTDLSELATALAAAWAEARDVRVEVADDALAGLADYRWPGNLRELESVLDASLAACAGGQLRAADLHFLASAPLAPVLPAEPPQPVPALEVEEPSSDEPAEEARAQPEPAPVPRTEYAPSIAVREIVSPLAEEIRPPLRALRTYANLLEQRPEDPSVRQELAGIVEGDLSRVETTLQRLERFATLGVPELGPVDLPALVAAELQLRHGEMREKELVVLRELDHDAPAAIADEKQIRFAIGALLDRSLRMVPTGGDLYVGSLHRAARDDAGPAHRLLIRFHSPEEVLMSPADAPGPPVPIEVVLARDLIERMGGAFAIDASGAQDNVILIELPAAPVA